VVNLFFEDVEVLDLRPEFFVSWLSELCIQEGKTLGEITVVFSSDDYLLEVNREHLNHDYYTDIITFDYCEGDVVSGDLFISVDRVRENAIEFNEMFHVELNRVVAHGTLHLIGYGDKSGDEAKLMREKESFALGLIVPRGT
jgi:rRNA maturation RNase YbeY